MKKVISLLLLILLLTACSSQEPRSLTIVTGECALFEQVAEEAKEAGDNAIRVTAVNTFDEADINNTDIIAASELTYEQRFALSQAGVSLIELDSDTESECSVKTDAEAMGAIAAEEMFMNDDFSSELEVASDLFPMRIAVLVGEDIPSSKERANSFVRKMQELLEMKYPQRISVKDSVGMLTSESASNTFVTIYVFNAAKIEGNTIAKYDAFCATSYSAAIELSAIETSGIKFGMDCLGVEDIDESINTSIEEFTEQILNLAKNNAVKDTNVTVGYSYSGD